MDHPNRHRDSSVGAGESPIDVDAPPTESGADAVQSPPEASLGPADVAFLLAVPLVLIGVFLLPKSVRLRDCDGSRSEPVPPSVAFGSALFFLLLFVGFPRVTPADGASSTSSCTSSGTASGSSCRT